MVIKLDAANALAVVLAIIIDKIIKAEQKANSGMVIANNKTNNK
jgi:hypothetical protein